MASILLVGHDPNLLSTRCEVLLTLGAEVESSAFREAKTLLEERRFDLVVLCHTMSVEECEELTTIAHGRHDGVKVVELVSSFTSKAGCPGVPIDATVPTDPAALTDRIRHLLTFRDSLGSEVAIVGGARLGK